MLCTLGRFQLYGTCTRQCIVREFALRRVLGVARQFRWPQPVWARVATRRYRNSLEKKRREVAQDKGNRGHGESPTYSIYTMIQVDKIRAVSCTSRSRLVCSMPLLPQVRPRRGGDRNRKGAGWTLRANLERTEYPRATTGTSSARATRICTVEIRTQNPQTGVKAPSPCVTSSCQTSGF